MLEFLPESTGACLGFKMSGKVTEKERHAMLPKLDEAIAAHGKINLLYLMVNFEGWEGFDTGDPDFRLRKSRANPDRVNPVFVNILTYTYVKISYTGFI